VEWLGTTAVVGVTLAPAGRATPATPVNIGLYQAPCVALHFEFSRPSIRLDTAMHCSPQRNFGPVALHLAKIANTPMP